MTTSKEQSKKKKLLRHNEYYDIQEELDKLYAGSKRNKKFNKLMDLILDEKNIQLAYRNIKKNKGGDDKYENLVYLKKNVHKLIHATDKEVIEKYKEDISPSQNSLNKINRLRKLVGNYEI